MTETKIENPTEPKQPEGASPAGEAPAQPTKSTAEAGLLNDLKDERAKRQALESGLDSLRKELEALKNQKPAAKADATSSDDLKALHADVQAIKSEAQRVTLSRELGLRTVEQAQKVQEMLNKYPDLKASEALSLAMSRDPETFGGTDKRGFNPAQHALLRPSGAGAPPVVTLKEKSEAIAKMRFSRDQSTMNPMEAAKQELALHGALLRDALGWNK